MALTITKNVIERNGHVNFNITIWIFRVTQSWYATVQRALIKDIQVLFTYEEDASHGPMFGLYNLELTAIKPNYEAMIKQGQLKVTDMGIATSKLNIYFCTHFCFKVCLSLGHNCNHFLYNFIK